MENCALARDRDHGLREGLRIGLLALSQQCGWNSVSFGAMNAQMLSYYSGPATNSSSSLGFRRMYGVWNYDTVL